MRDKAEPLKLTQNSEGNIPRTQTADTHRDKDRYNKTSHNNPNHDNDNQNTHHTDIDNRRRTIVIMTTVITTY